MRISDWSQTCALPIFRPHAEPWPQTADGRARRAEHHPLGSHRAIPRALWRGSLLDGAVSRCLPARRTDRLVRGARPADFRRDRKSVVQGKSVSVRVDLGGRRLMKITNNNNTTI